MINSILSPKVVRIPSFTVSERQAMLSVSEAHPTTIVIIRGNKDKKFMNQATVYQTYRQMVGRKSNVEIQKKQVFDDQNINPISPH
ncbi:conserved hypothetical protein [Ricinus communis]|uniref:Uncharacterized protein n=1 Tax=Ricinus communis TaxID=3988 RepID=B9RBQ0_RICCO|nr:conserved hypothetical protein [Ricinus communis]